MDMDKNNATAELTIYEEVVARLVARLNQAVLALNDLEAALRLGDEMRVCEGVFIWSQHKDEILAGNETWADQKFDPAFPRTSG
jgi:hypothetical protein